MSFVSVSGASAQQSNQPTVPATGVLADRASLCGKISILDRKLLETILEMRQARNGWKLLTETRKKFDNRTYFVRTFNVPTDITIKIAHDPKAHNKTVCQYTARIKTANIDSELESLQERLTKTAAIRVLNPYFYRSGSGETIQVSNIVKASPDSRIYQVTFKNTSGYPF
jgi:hypothetical protein